MIGQMSRKVVAIKKSMRWAELIIATVLTVSILPESMIGQEQETDIGWAQAHQGRVLEFPADHARHPDYRIEWWYYTGNLEGGDGQQVLLLLFGTVYNLRAADYGPDLLE